MKKNTRGDITHITALFDIYKERIQAPQATVIDAFIEVVEDLFSISLSKKYCRYSVFQKIIKITAPGPLKSEILIRKEEILTHLTARLGIKNAPKDIL